jgi:hypothetical protein
MTLTLADILTISGAVNFLTSLFLGLLLLAKSSVNKANRYFAYFCFVVALWSLVYAVQFNTQDPVWLRALLLTDMTAAFFIPPTFFHFVVHFLKKKVPAWVIAFNYWFAVAATLIAHTPLYAGEAGRFLGFWWLTPGPLFKMVFLTFAEVVSN